MSDNLDHLLTDAFTEFDAAERGANPPAPGAVAVRHTVTHRRRVRYASLSVVGAALLAVPVTLLLTSPHGNNSPPPADHTPTPTPTPTPPAEILNATLTLAAFPGYDTACRAGTLKFVNGVATAGAATWTIGSMAPIRADLDGAAGEELVTSIVCHANGAGFAATQLLALTAGDDGQWRALGYVINSSDVPNLSFVPEDVRMEAGVVLVATDGPLTGDGLAPCHPQVRGYAFRDGAFKQVSGPTTFPPPVTDIRAVDFPNAGLVIGIADPTGALVNDYCVAMAGGTGTARVYIDGDPTKGSQPRTFTIGPVSFVADHSLSREAAAAIVTHRSGEGVTTYALQVFTVEDDRVAGQVVLTSGTHGVTRIDQVEVSGDQLVVTLMVDGATRKWTYQQSTVSSLWERVN